MYRATATHGTLRGSHALFLLPRAGRTSSQATPKQPGKLPLLLFYATLFATTALHAAIRGIRAPDAPHWDVYARTRRIDAISFSRYHDNLSGALPTCSLTLFLFVFCCNTAHNVLRDYLLYVADAALSVLTE